MSTVEFGVPGKTEGGLCLCAACAKHEHNPLIPQKSSFSKNIF